MKGDWTDASAPETLKVSFTSIKFDNDSLLEADMSATGASAGHETTTIKLEVCLLNNEWKIVTMNY